MSRKHWQQQPQPSAPRVEPRTDSPATPRHIDPARKCPACFNGLGGLGVVYHSTPSIRYYKCRSCGLTWKAARTADEVNYAEPEIRER